MDQIQEFYVPKKLTKDEANDLAELLDSLNEEGKEVDHEDLLNLNILYRTQQSIGDLENNVLKIIDYLDSKKIGKYISEVIEDLASFAKNRQKELTYIEVDLVRIYNHSQICAAVPNFSFDDNIDNFLPAEPSIEVSGKRTNYSYINNQIQ